MSAFLVPYSQFFKILWMGKHHIYVLTCKILNKCFWAKSGIYRSQDLQNYWLHKIIINKGSLKQKQKNKVKIRVKMKEDCTFGAALGSGLLLGLYVFPLPTTLLFAFWLPSGLSIRPRNNVLLARRWVIMNINGWTASNLMILGLMTADSAIITAVAAAASVPKVDQRGGEAVRKN